MKTRIVCMIIAFLIALPLTAAQTALAARNADDRDGVVATPGTEKATEILVTFVKGASADRQTKILADEKLEQVGEIASLQTRIIKIPENKPLSEILELSKKHPEIAGVEENSFVYTSELLSPNDPVYISADKEQMAAAHIEDLWGLTKGGMAVVVAVLDTGVSADHEDLAGGRIMPGRNFIDGSDATADDNGHGTRVAGIIAAEGNNQKGIAGVNWKARILPVKVLGASGSGPISAVASGIVYAADSGAKVINMSFGAKNDSTTLHSAVNYAVAKGCILVAPAGNGGVSIVEYPAFYPNVIGVGSHANGTRADYSSYGEGLDAITFGSVTSTVKAGGYGVSAGTSYAAAQITGALSIAKAMYPALDQKLAHELVTRSCTDLEFEGPDAETGYGLFDYKKMYDYLKAMGKPLVEPDVTSPVIRLIGDDTITLMTGQQFEEPGYVATDDRDGDLTAMVEVENKVEYSDGMYGIFYTVTDSAGNVGKATRVVVVRSNDMPIPGDDLAPPETEPAPTVFSAASSVVEMKGLRVTITGSSTIILHLGSKYIEQGATAADLTDGDLTAQVKTSGEVDASKAGEYKVTYTAVNSAGTSVSAVRTVRIIEPTSIPSRIPYTFTGSFASLTSGKQVHEFTADADGQMDMMISVWGGTIQATIFDGSGAQIYSEQMNVGAIKIFDSFRAGDYTLEITPADLDGGLSYAVSMQMPEAVYEDFAEDEVPLALHPGDSDYNPWYIALIFGCLALAAVVTTVIILQYRKKKAKQE